MRRCARSSRVGGRDRRSDPWKAHRCRSRRASRLVGLRESRCSYRLARREHRHSGVGGHRQCFGCAGDVPLHPDLMTAVYNQAKCSPCTLRFHVATEGGWDIGGASGCLAAALLSEAGAPLPVEILISLAGTVVSLIVLRRYYKTLALSDLPLTH